MEKIIVSSWKTVGYGHYNCTEQEITYQERKIREICDQLGIDCPEVATNVTSLSTRTEIIADESVLEHVEPIYYSDAD
ncbi:hypothetical protein FNW02_30640 [Komarekiella sp. 'clone 1']|uniref:Uncharacterized protein n=1 Tax=Komarekiella delphini-convector SJRDD-AB1 TaxID=2593771 RepID=A0AA40T3K7_9NOST|nr:hypothetical protein [Komarekiella delphini-convector]MBD6620038.1 hypothetical protein [Komarekiella delphini-convector SJRDD-AB1]